MKWLAVALLPLMAAAAMLAIVLSRGDGSGVSRPPATTAVPNDSWFGELAESAGYALNQLDPAQRQWLLVRYYAQCHRWQDVLDAAAQLPPSMYEAHAAFQVNRALYHLGRLPYDMFAHPQQAGTDTLILATQTNITGVWYLDQADIWLELGQINVAEQNAHEALWQFEDHPEIYKRLATINLLKGNPAGARTFLVGMQRWPTSAAWAHDRLRHVEDGNILAVDPELNQIHEVMNTTKDKAYGAAGELSPGDLFAQLLEGGTRNRMAFEYYMGLLLLTRNVENFAANIGHMNDYGYDEFPPLYQEALLLYNAKHPAAAVMVPGRSISQDTRDRFERFSALYQSAAAQGPQQILAREQLRSEFGDSYFYYFTFGQSGRGGLSGS